MSDAVSVDQYTMIPILLVTSLFVWVGCHLELSGSLIGRKIFCHFSICNICESLVSYLVRHGLAIMLSGYLDLFLAVSYYLSLLY